MSTHALRDILGSLVEYTRFCNCLLTLLLSYQYSRIRTLLLAAQWWLEVCPQVPCCGVSRRFLTTPLSTLAEPSTCPTFHFTFSRTHHVITCRRYHLCIPLCGYAVVFHQRPHLHSFNECLHHPSVLHQGQHH